MIYDGFWICELSRRFPCIVFYEFFLKLTSDNYILLLCAKATNNSILREETEVRTAIKQFPSVDEFELIHIGEDFALYKISIDDIKYTTSAVRILARVKEAEVYKFVAHRAINGIEYLNTFFPNNDAFDKCISHLEEEEFQIVRDDEDFGISTEESDNIISEFLNIFDILGIEKKIAESLSKSLHDLDDPENILKEDTNFIDAVQNNEPLKALFNIILNFPSYLSFLEQIRIL